MLSNADSEIDNLGKQRANTGAIDVLAAPCQRYKNLRILPGFYFYQPPTLCANQRDRLPRSS